MFFTYIWQSSVLTHKEAHDRFSSVLLKQCKLYEAAFGREPGLKIKQIENILIGQIQYVPGVLGWEPWLDRGDAGLVWGGVCENYLGKKLDTKEIFDIIKLLENSPKELLSWNGMFSIVSWNGKKVLLTTAATECPTLWYTEGPNGWASGPRSAPLLEMVDRQKAPNLGALGLYLKYGYFIGGHSPFDHVRRVRDRQQIVIEQDSKPLFATYASLGEYLGSGNRSVGWKESVSLAADRIIQRVNNQLKHSLNPVVLLTGGHDSRAIAAAAKKTGYPFITATSGPEDSQDVIIAAKVAKVLNVDHRLDGDPVGPDILCSSLKRLRLWVQITEGLLPLNYCLQLKDFLGSNLPFPSTREQFEHGLEPGIGRGSYYPDVELEKLKAMSLEEAHGQWTINNSYLRSNTEADSLVQDIFLHLDNDLNEVHGNTYHWFELLLWRERGLMWGMDLQSVYSPIRWPWIPLFDRELMKLSWHLTVEQKKSGHYLNDVYALIIPALGDVECPQYAGMKKARLAGRIKRRLATEIGHYSKKIGVPFLQRYQSENDRKLPDFWEAVIFSQREHTWKEFIEKKDLLKLVRLAPGNDLLWRLSTVDLMSEIFF